MNSLTKMATLASVAVTTNTQPLFPPNLAPSQNYSHIQVAHQDIIGARALQYAIAKERDPEKLQAHLDAYQALLS